MFDVLSSMYALEIKDFLIFNFLILWLHMICLFLFLFIVI